MIPILFFLQIWSKNTSDETIFETDCFLGKISENGVKRTYFVADFLPKNTGKSS
jgi:hypothetical protein